MKFKTGDQIQLKAKYTHDSLGNRPYYTVLAVCYSLDRITIQDDEAMMIHPKAFMFEFYEKPTISVTNTEAKYEAARFNKGKADLTLLPKIACEQEALVWAFGAKKYTRDNWKKLWGKDTYAVANASLLRHAMAIANGELIDEESGLPHAAHIRCNAAMILEYQMKKGKK